MRQVEIDFTKNICYENIFAGYTGEHNATELKLITSEELMSISDSQVVVIQNGNATHRVDVKSNNENKYCYRKDNIIHFYLDKSFTQYTGIIVQVEFYKSNESNEIILIAKTPVATNVFLKPSPNIINYRDEGTSVSQYKVCVVETFPEKPIPGTVIALNTEVTKDLSTVHIYGDEIIDETGNLILDNVKPIGKIKISKLPDRISYEWMKDGQIYFNALIITDTIDGSGNQFLLILNNEQGAPIFSISRMDFTTDSYMQLNYFVEGSSISDVDIEKSGWYTKDMTSGDYTIATDEQLSFFEILLEQCYLMDYFNLVSAEERQQLLDAGWDISTRTLVDNIIQTFINNVVSPGIYLAKKNDSDCIEWILL